MASGAPLLTRGSWSEVKRLVRHPAPGDRRRRAAAASRRRPLWCGPTRRGRTRTTRYRAIVIGPESLHLRLSIEGWAADGLLAIFFFVVGLELKREFVAGDLRDPARAVLPIVAAVGGMVVPAAVYVATNMAMGSPDTLSGWAVPTATDIAFALAVLAVLSTHLPSALRTFLLTLAVVDDLLAITVIAVFYTDHLAPGPLAFALVPIALFALCVQRGVRQWWMLVPLAVSPGRSCTPAGCTPRWPAWCSASPFRCWGTGAAAERFEHLLRPVSAGFAVPVFAFFAAGVTVGGLSGLGDALLHPVTLGVIAGLVLGKPLGVWGTTYLLARFTHASLDDDLAWRDVLGVSLLAGIGFTVSLLIGELAFGYGTPDGADAKIAVLTGSVVAGLLAAIVLISRNAAYRRIHEAETADTDHDGVPDVYRPQKD